MAIQEHPTIGAILMCDFDSGFKRPEMCKKRPVIVISPKISNRPQLCTVVTLSMTPPKVQMPYHRQIRVRPLLPDGWASDAIWVKGDMVNAVAFHRLGLIRRGKSPTGKRIYHLDPIEADQLQIVRQCILHAMGLNLDKICVKA